jgi:hypothetical protein
LQTREQESVKERARLDDATLTNITKGLVIGQDHSDLLLKATKNGDHPAALELLRQRRNADQIKSAEDALELRKNALEEQQAALLDGLHAGWGAKYSPVLKQEGIATLYDAAGMTRLNLIECLGPALQKAGLSLMDIGTIVDGIWGWHNWEANGEAPEVEVESTKKEATPRRNLDKSSTTNTSKPKKGVEKEGLTPAGLARRRREKVLKNAEKRIEIVSGGNEDAAACPWSKESLAVLAIQSAIRRRLCWKGFVRRLLSMRKTRKTLAVIRAQALARRFHVRYELWRKKDKIERKNVRRHAWHTAKRIQSALRRY